MSINEIFLVIILVFLIIIVICYIFLTSGSSGTSGGLEGGKLWIPQTLSNQKDTSTTVQGPPLKFLKNKFKIVHLDDDVIFKDDIASKKKSINKVAFDIIVKLIGNNNYAKFYGKKSYIIRESSDILDETDSWPARNMETILKNDYPYHKDDGIILSEKYYNMLFVEDGFINTDLGFNEPRVIIPASKYNKNISNSNSVPKIIHQSFSSRMVPKCYADAINTWIEMNPDYEYRYYDDSDMRRMIKNNFSKEILFTYDKLIPGAFKCDLWRLCAIYLYGGFYADIKMGCLIKLDDIIEKNKMIFVRDRNPIDIFNAFFASYPQNPLLLNLINQIIKNVKVEYYGSGTLNVTGPVMIGKYLQDHKIILEENKRCKILHHVNSKGGQITYNNQIYFDTRANYELRNYNLASNISGLAHYGDLWKSRKIYSSEQ